MAARKLAALGGLQPNGRLSLVYGQSPGACQRLTENRALSLCLRLWLVRERWCTGCPPGIFLGCNAPGQHETKRNPSFPHPEGPKKAGVMSPLRFLSALWFLRGLWLLEFPSVMMRCGNSYSSCIISLSHSGKPNTTARAFIRNSSFGSTSHLEQSASMALASVGNGFPACTRVSGLVWNIQRAVQISCSSQCVLCCILHYVAFP